MKDGNRSGGRSAQNQRSRAEEDSSILVKQPVGRPQPEPKPTSGKRQINKKRVINILMIVVAVLSVTLVVMCVMAYSALKDILANPSNVLTSSAPRETIPGEVLTTMPPQMLSSSGETLKKNKDIVSFLFVGADIDSRRGIDKYGYQADTMMLVVIDLATSQATVISIPRDTKAVINKVDSKGNITGERTDLINAAFSYGGGPDKYSWINTLAAVNKLLGLDTGRYMGIDIDGIPPIVDAVGGVPMKLDADFSSADSSMTKGAQLVLNGRQAELYVRHRKLAGMDGSDTSRAKRQQQFVKSFVNVIKSKGADTYAISLFMKIQQYVYTNMTLAEITAMAQVLRTLDMDSVETVTLPGMVDSSGKYYVIDEAQAKEIITRAFYK